jgi:hypothetical protein
MLKLISMLDSSRDIMDFESEGARQEPDMKLGIDD